MSDEVHPAWGLLVLVVIVSFVVALFSVPSGMHYVAPGHEAVIFDYRSGTQKETVPEGIHWKTPWVTKDYDYNIQRQKERVTNMEVPSSDEQAMVAIVSVHYQLQPGKAWWVHQNVGENYKGVVIEPAIEDSVKASTSKFTWQELLTRPPELNDMVEKRLKPKLNDIYVNLLYVDVEDIDPPEKLRESVELKVAAEQEALREKELLEAEKYRAQQEVVKAQGRANATLVEAYADADAARVINEAIQDSPGYLKLKEIQTWNGLLPLDANVVVYGGGSGLLISEEGGRAVLS